MGSTPKTSPRLRLPLDESRLFQYLWNKPDHRKKLFSKSFPQKFRHNYESHSFNRAVFHKPKLSIQQFGFGQSNPTYLLIFDFENDVKSVIEAENTCSLPAPFKFVLRR